MPQYSGHKLPTLLQQPTQCRPFFLIPQLNQRIYSYSMNLLERRLRHTRISTDQNRLLSLLPNVVASRQRGQKRSLLMESDSNIIGKDLNKQPSISIGWNPKLKRPSTNGVVSYFSEALQINSARRTSLIDDKENIQPLMGKPQSREHRSRPFLAQEPPKTASYASRGRQFRVTRHHKHSEFLQVKDMFDSEQEETQVSLKPYRIQPTSIEADADLYDMANPVHLVDIINPPKSPPEIVMIVQVEMFLLENSFWAPLKPTQRIKPQTRASLHYLTQHSQVVLLHDNPNVLQEFTQKVVEWRLPAWCSMLVSTRKQHKFYDLSDALGKLELLPSCDVFVIEAVSEEPGLQDQVLLPLCRSARVGLLLYRPPKRQLQSSANIMQLLQFRQRSLELRSSVVRSVRTDQLINLQQITNKVKNSKYLRSVAQIRRSLSATTTTKPLPTNLEDFKCKLVRYLRLLQSQAKQPTKTQSISFIVGDLLKHNYGIHSQLSNNKYSGAPRHQRAVIEISALNPPTQPQINYNCSAFLINL